MRRLLIIACFLPLTSLGQSIIKIKFPVDSFTNNVTYKQQIAVKGVKKNKIFPVVYKWFASNVTAKSIDTLPNNENVKTMLGDGIFTGLYTYRGAMARRPAENYSIYFTARIIVADEKLTIVLTGFRINIMDFTTTLESYFGKPLPGASGNDAYSADFFAMYSYVLNDVNFSALAMLKDVDKYVQKAQKKGKF